MKPDATSMGVTNKREEKNVYLAIWAWEQAGAGGIILRLLASFNLSNISVSVINVFSDNAVECFHTFRSLNHPLGKLDIRNIPTPQAWQR